MKVRKTPDHEVIEVTMHRNYGSADRLVLREPVGGRCVWTVLDCEKDPNDSRVTAMRCLPACRVDHRRG